MGEFHKRIKEDLESRMLRDFEQKDLLEHFMEVVEEAKKEFPEEKVNPNGHVQINNWFLEVKQWFERWFSGES